MHVMDEEGGGGKQASCLLAKQAVEFPHVLATLLSLLLMGTHIHILANFS